MRKSACNSHCWGSGAGADFWLSAFQAAIPAAFQRGGRMPSIGTGPRPADRVLPRTEGDLDQGSGAPPSGSATEGWSWILIYIFTPSHFSCLHYISSCFLCISLSLSLSLSLSIPLSLPPALPPSISLYLCLSVVARHVSSDAFYQAPQCICMGCHKYPLLNQSYFSHIIPP